MKNKIKKTAVVFAILSAALIFSSCVEIEHTLYKEKGNLFVGYKMLIDKNLLKMMGEDGDDISEEFDDITPNKNEAYIRDFRKINNDSKIGFSFEIDTAKVRYQDIEENEMLEKIIPSTKSNEIIISLFPFSSDDISNNTSDLDDDTLKMFMSNYYYTVNIDSSVMKNIRAAELYGIKNYRYSQIETIDVEKLSANMSRISIPIMTVLSAQEPVLRIK